MTPQNRDTRNQIARFFQFARFTRLAGHVRMGRPWWGRVLAVSVCGGIGAVMLAGGAAMAPASAQSAGGGNAATVPAAGQDGAENDPLAVFLKEYVDQAGLPGGVIGIGDATGGTRFAATGYASVNPDQAMTIDRQFYIGSLTKMMTAVVILQLASEGKIALSDPVGKYLSQAGGAATGVDAGIANADRATIRDLLRNTSGIPDYLDGDYFFDLVGRDPQHGWENIELLPLIAGREARFKPGGQYDPSNSNYILLGIVIAMVENAPVETVFQKRIFDRAKMTHTAFGHFPRPELLARGFDDANGDGQLEDVSDFDVGDHLTDGGVISTAGDMLKFARALFVDGWLLGPNALSRATEDTVFAGQGSYGYGLMVAKSDWGPVWGHDGIYFGYSAEFSWFPRQQVAVVFLSNGRALNDVAHLTGHLLPGLFGKPQ